MSFLVDEPLGYVGSGRQFSMPWRTQYSCRGQKTKNLAQEESLLSSWTVLTSSREILPMFKSLHFIFVWRPLCYGIWEKEFQGPRGTGRPQAFDLAIGVPAASVWDKASSSHHSWEPTSLSPASPDGWNVVRGNFLHVQISVSNMQDWTTPSTMAILCSVIFREVGFTPPLGSAEFAVEHSGNGSTQTGSRHLMLLPQSMMTTLWLCAHAMQLYMRRRRSVGLRILLHVLLGFWVELSWAPAMCCTPLKGIDGTNLCYLGFPVLLLCLQVP